MLADGPWAAPEAPHASQRGVDDCRHYPLAAPPQNRPQATKSTVVPGIPPPTGGSSRA